MVICIKITIEPVCIYEGTCWLIIEVCSVIYILLFKSKVLLFTQCVNNALLVTHWSQKKKPNVVFITSLNTFRSSFYTTRSTQNWHMSNMYLVSGTCSFISCLFPTMSFLLFHWLLLTKLLLLACHISSSTLEHGKHCRVTQCKQRVTSRQIIVPFLCININ